MHYQHTTGTVLPKHVRQLLSVIYLRALLVAFVGFTQAFSGLPAASGRIKSSHHLTGAVTKSPLYGVSIIQLLDLEKQAWKWMKRNS